jgi:DNA-binding MarR family transcriptional regulator
VGSPRHRAGGPEVEVSHGPLLFNPSRLDREELETTFVGRQQLLSRLEADLVADAERSTSRHWLLMGPRGIGKSHFTELLSRRIRDRGWPVVRLPEEHYQVSNVADLLEQIVTRLLDGPSPFASESSVHRLEEGAIDWLRQHRRRSSGPILVVLENLGDFLDQLSLRDQQRLRELLMRDAPIVLVASATGPVEATSHHDAPFYDFFHPIVLEDLSREDVKQLVTTRLARENREDVLATKDEILGRVEAMYHFSGGNPRLVLALYDVLRDGVTEALFDQMLRLLDQVTPYYQSRLRDISPQMARVLTEMSIAEGPLTPSEIARRTRLGTNQVTANIAKLVDARLVVATGRPDKRRRYYEVVDRLLRAWISLRANPFDGKPYEDLCTFFERRYRPRSSGLPPFVHEADARSGYAPGRRAEPWATLQRVGDAPDRAAALGSLHPEMREAIAILLRS